MQIRIGDTKVVNSRYFKGQNVVWRRRKTTDGLVFTTRERIDLNGKIVHKKDSKRTESYQPAKLLISLVSTLTHREDALEAAWALLITVENKILEVIAEVDELSSQDIARAVLDVLKAYDADGFLNYARHHTDLVSKDDLIKAISD